MEIRVCTKCETELPATNEYFSKAKYGKYGLKSVCKDCVKKYDNDNSEHIKKRNAEYYELNAKRIKERTKRYYEDNIDCARASRREYIKKNPDIIQNHNKEYYKKNSDQIKKSTREYEKQNIERVREYKRAYRKRNSEYFREYHREWGKNNSFKWSMYAQRRSAKKSLLICDLTQEEWLTAKEHFGGACAYCGVVTKLEQDHFHPLSRGGGYTKNNIIPACRTCNANKNARLFEEWYPTSDQYSEEREAKIKDYIKKL